VSGRTCAECGATITRLSKSGLCKKHAMARMHADPAYRARREAGLAAHFDKPGVREAWGRHLRAGHDVYRANMTAEERQRASDHGKWLIREYLSQPDINARSLSPEARRKAIATYIETRMGWCPLPLRQQYTDLIVRKKYTAAEARTIIEEQIPGTAAHARRAIASTQLVQLMRHQRDQAQAY
jgi:hypothetical protein